MELQLETTSTCNARCHFCVYPTAGRQGGLMSMGLFEKIASNILDALLTVPRTAPGSS